MEEGGAVSVPPRFILVDGRPFEVPGRRGWGGDSAFIDWINFTAQEEAFFQGSTPVADDQVVMDHVSPVCREIFGFGVSHQRDNGANFYRDSYVLGDGYGIVCHGGQRGTVLISISGEGCAAAKEGWEERLRQWLEAHKAVARITRIDLAHDDYDGALTVDQLDQLFDQGGFNCGGRNPDVEHRGNWKHPNGKGRTLYVGNRRNGKFFRGYEKGKQLGDPASNWLRLEVEFKSVDREIPFDVLTRAGEYLAAAYPCLAFISEHQERIITTQKRCRSPTPACANGSGVSVAPPSMWRSKWKAPSKPSLPNVYAWGKCPSVCMFSLWFRMRNVQTEQNPPAGSGPLRNGSRFAGAV